MKNPFRTMLKATKLARRGRPIAAAIALQALVPTAPKPKRKAARPKRPAGAGVVAGKTATRPVPDSFIHDRFQCRHGALGYWLYTPKGSARRRMPLVVMLHGCTQTATLFALGTGMNALADQLGFLVLYPEQSPSANLARCWNWHRPGNQRRGAGEPALLAALTRHAVAIGRANPARVHVAGLSAGGSTAAILGAAYPDIFAAIGIHSAAAPSGIVSLPGALAAMRHGPSGKGAPRRATRRPPPAILFHGDQDDIVHPDNAAGISAAMRDAHPGASTQQVREGRVAGGKAWRRTVHRGADGAVLLEEWTVHGGTHAWSGGRRGVPHTDPAGPDASREMLRFFLARRRD